MSKSCDDNGIDYSNRLTIQDIRLIGDILNLAKKKFTDKGVYVPTALDNAVKHFNELFNKEMSWGDMEL